ncbi:hypothetical protein ApDm4_0204 [Acetobacter pomorum]|nr:hypothetical protein ApDm4_0204 [Acetobacter pomorum]
MNSVAVRNILIELAKSMVMSQKQIFTLSLHCLSFALAIGQP